MGEPWDFLQSSTVFKLAHVSGLYNITGRVGKKEYLGKLDSYRTAKMIRGMDTYHYCKYKGVEGGLFPLAFKFIFVGVPLFT